MLSTVAGPRLIAPYPRARATPDLWSLNFGTGGNNGDPNTLFFTDGINGELRSGGIETFESCQGGPGHSFPDPTVPCEAYR